MDRHQWHKVRSAEGSRLAGGQAGLGSPAGVLWTPRTGSWARRMHNVRPASAQPPPSICSAEAFDVECSATEADEFTVQLLLVDVQDGSVHLALCSKAGHMHLFCLPSTGKLGTGWELQPSLHHAQGDGPSAARHVLIMLLLPLPHVPAELAGAGVARQDDSLVLGFTAGSWRCGAVRFSTLLGIDARCAGRWCMRNACAAAPPLCWAPVRCCVGWAEGGSIHGPHCGERHPSGCGACSCPPPIRLPPIPRVALLAARRWMWLSRGRREGSASSCAPRCPAAPTRLQAESGKRCRWAGHS